MPRFNNPSCLISNSVRSAFLTLAILTSAFAQPQYNISTVAGVSGGALRVGLIANQTYLPGTNSVAVDSRGRLYISTYSYGLLRVNESGVIDLIVGNNNPNNISAGAGMSIYTQPTAIKFKGAGAMTIDSSDNLYIADGSSRIRRIDGASGVITTVAGGAAGNGYSGDGGPATSAGFRFIASLAVDKLGNLFIGDQTRVRRVDQQSGFISTVAGSGKQVFVPGSTGDGGPAVNATINTSGIAVDSAGNLYIADGSARIRTVSAATAIISTYIGTGTPVDAGDGGPATAATLKYPQTVGFDTSGNLYVVGGTTIRKVSAASGLISTIAGSGVSGHFTGSGGPAEAQTISAMDSIAIDRNGNVYLTKWNGSPPLVLKLDQTAAMVSLAAGNPAGLGDNGLAVEALLASPGAMAADSAGNVFIWDQGTARIRKISAATGIITTYAGGRFGTSGDGGPATGAGLATYVWALACDPAGNLYIAEQYLIRKVSVQTGVITTIGGGGSSYADNVAATSAQLYPGSAMYADGSVVYFFDASNSGLRKIDLATGLISNVARDPNRPYQSGLDRDSLGNFLYTSPSPGAVSRIAAGQMSETVVVPGNHDCSTNQCIDTSSWTGAQLGDGGLAKNATLFYPSDVKVDSADNLYIADNADRRIRYVSAATGKIATIAGTNTAGCPLGPGAAANASLTTPGVLASGPRGSLYVLDWKCQQVYQLTPQSPYTGYVDTVTCQSISGWAADRTRLNQSITVSIYDGATLLATISANQSRADVGALLGDNGSHGFSYAVPASLLDGKAHNIHVVYENNAALDLAGSPKALTCGTSYVGFVDSASCTGITGWIADRARPNQVLTVTLWDGGTQIASAIANASRPDVGAVVGDNGLHGFALTLPAGYPNLVSHSLQVRYETSSTQVLGSPVTLTCGGGASYSGWVDSSTCAGISGWAADSSRPNQSINVTLWDGVTQIASTTAAALRGDVGAVLRDNGQHGFTLLLPSSYANGVSHGLQVRYETSASQLPGSPVTVNCGGSSYVGWFDHAGCDVLSGWAADKSHLNQSISVDILDGSTLVSSILATASRADVGGVLGDNGSHGFSVPTPAALKDGKPHSVQIRYSGSSLNQAQSVGNSPQALVCGGPSNYVGWVDTVSCSTISGWAADKSALNTSLSVEIYDGTTLLGTVAAGQLRSDVAAVLGDSGLHGFVFGTPSGVKDGKVHTITVRPAGGGNALPGVQAVTCQ